jgi:hypothetical protein
MLHLKSVPVTESQPQPYAEAVARLASVRHALRLVDGGFTAGPEGDCDDAVAAEWDEAGEAKRRTFDTRSSQLVGATAAGVEALLHERQNGREPHEEASQALVDQIRRELAEVAKHIFR